MKKFESYAQPPNTDHECRRKDLKGRKNVTQTHTVVATLIATVAGFALPGGYNSDGPYKGMGTIIKAFVAFVISNSLAMLLSISAVSVHLCFKQNSEMETMTMRNVVDITFLLAYLAIKVMVVAFVTGTYTVLSAKKGIAIPLCVLGCIFFLFFWFLHHKLHKWVVHDRIFQVHQKLRKTRRKGKISATLSKQRKKVSLPTS